MSHCSRRWTLCEESSVSKKGYEISLSAERLPASQEEVRYIELISLCWLVSCPKDIGRSQVLSCLEISCPKYRSPDHFIHLDSIIATILGESKNYETPTLMPFVAISNIKRFHNEKIACNPHTESPCRRTNPCLLCTTYGRVVPWWQRLEIKQK
jgi:hypothetical protein